MRSMPPWEYQASNGSVDSKSVLLLDDTTITVVAVLSVETLEHDGGMEVSGDG